MSDKPAVAPETYPERPIENERPKRETKSYMTLYTGLQSRVDTAISLLAFVKVEKGSQEMLGAVLGLLKGNGS